MTAYQHPPPEGNLGTFNAPVTDNCIGMGLDRISAAIPVAGRYERKR
jgi:hypothetical protein